MSILKFLASIILPMLLVSFDATSLGAKLEGDGFRSLREGQFYPSSALYDKIDGGAEIFMEYGFEQLEEEELQGPEGTIWTIDIYTMKDEAGAFGIFSYFRDPLSKPLGVGSDSEAHEGGLLFWQGSYFVQIMAQRPEGEMVSVAKKLSSLLRLEKEGRFPLSRLPEAFKVPKSERLMRGPLALRQFFPLLGEDPLKFGEGELSLLAEYAVDEERFKGLVALYQHESEALESLKRLIGYLGERYKKAHPPFLPPEGELHAFSLPDDGMVVVGAEGPVLFVLQGALGPKGTMAFLSELSEQKASRPFGWG